MYREDKLFIDTTPKTFTPDLRGLIGWLETQNPATEYDWANCDGACLLDQFARNLPLGTWYGSGGHWDPLSPLCNVALRTPHTFGAALSRARALLP